MLWVEEFYVPVFLYLHSMYYCQALFYGVYLMYKRIGSKFHIFMVFLKTAEKK